MANSVDPDMMPHSVASYLGLHCLQRPICPNTQGYHGKYCVSVTPHMPEAMFSHVAAHI